MGVMKAVGEAVREGQSYNYEHMGAAYSFRCIGIAPWGYVEKRDQLLPKDGNVCNLFPADTWRNNDVNTTVWCPNSVRCPNSVTHKNSCLTI